MLNLTKIKTPAYVQLDSWQIPEIKFLHNVTSITAPQDAQYRVSAAGLSWLEHLIILYIDKYASYRSDFSPKFQFLSYYLLW